MRIWILAMATVAVLIGAVGGAYWYGGKGVDESALVLNTAPTTNDGIKVHGHWTVIVTNPDGIVDAMHEFDNALDSQGTSLLASLLAGTTSIQKGVTPNFANGWGFALLDDSGSVGFTCTESGSQMISDVNVIRDVVGGNVSLLRLVGTCTVDLAPETNNLSLNGMYTLADVTEGVTVIYNSPAKNEKLLFTGVSINPIQLEDSQQISINVSISFN